MSVLITGPAGAGKSWFAKQFSPDVVRLDTFRAKSVTTDWRGVPLGRHAYEGSLSASDPLVRKLRPTLVLLIKPSVFAFRKSNALKYEAVKGDPDVPAEWKESFLTWSQFSQRDLDSFYFNELRWWRRGVRMWKGVVTIVTMPEYDPLRAWDELKD